MRLEDVQQAYAQAIYANDSTPLENMINSSETFSTEQRVGVYQNNTIGTLKNTLSSTYPICESLVGTDYFKQLSQHHIKLNPSDDRNLDKYGANFPETLATLIEQRPELAELAYLTDVAKLEWIHHQTYFADDRQSFDLEAFAALAPEEQTQVIFKLADDVSIIDSPYPIYDIWDCHEQGIDPEITHQEHNYLLIQRTQWKITTELIDEHYFALLNAINSQKSLIELTSFLEISPIDLATLIEQRIVTGFLDK